MTVCPLCRTENIKGADHCTECGQPLVDEHLSPPQNEVERTLISDRVSVLSPHKAISVAADAALGDVLKVMVEHRIGCVVVADGDRPVGIFSERDALTKVGPRAKELSARPISQFMTPDPQTLVGTAKLAFAVQRMDQGGYRHVPIVNADGELTGIISARDILRHLTESLDSDG